MTLTVAQLARIMQCPESRAQRWLPALLPAMAEFEISTPRRIAHFLAQVGHESLSLSRVEEGLHYTTLANLQKVFGHRIPGDELHRYLRNAEGLANRVYANRLGNGNVASGDGWRFRGRSPVQLTFRNNYAEIGMIVCIDLLNQPDLACDTYIGARISAAYWKHNRLNPLADANDTVGASKRINLGDARARGTPNGLADRISRTNRALSILGG